MNYKTKNNYSQINFEERVKIEYLLQGCLFGASNITNILKIAKLTIKRELDRNTTNGKYSAKKAQDIYSERFITKYKSPEFIYPWFSRLFLRYFENKWHNAETI